MAHVPLIGMAWVDLAPKSVMARIPRSGTCSPDPGRRVDRPIPNGLYEWVVTAGWFDTAGVVFTGSAASSPSRARRSAMWSLYRRRSPKPVSRPLESGKADVVA